MKVNDWVHLVGSGYAGFQLTDEYDCNVYLINGGSGMALVDTGAGLDPDAILAEVRKDGLDPAAIRSILLTHAHADHAGGASALAGKLGATIYALPDAVRFGAGPDLEAISLAPAIQAGTYPEDYRFRAFAAETVNEGDVIAVGGLSVRVIETPGHSDGHAGFLLEAEGRKLLFAGDLVFGGGRISLLATWDSRLNRYAESIGKVNELRIDGLFPGHAAFLLRDAWRHVAEAAHRFERLEVPRNYNG
ncbi:MBL fold metallo-hydrolase [Cohnella caldifontis]|uniref:MBL fold metallo-hydrolase n=1 Tax=Cohnella caldifontis TaxID=3027471 RepID=UPI0023EB9489|nr:MBL fold metallo-hydrolase [Cohnella sp. YIM B05605]